MPIKIQKAKPFSHSGALQLGLGSLDGLDHQIPDVTSSLVEVEAHPITKVSLQFEFGRVFKIPLTPQSLANDVELDAVLVNHIRNSPSLIDNLTPSIPVEVFAG